MPTTNVLTPRLLLTSRSARPNTLSCLCFKLEITVVTSVTATHSDITPANTAANTNTGPRTYFHTRRRKECDSTGVATTCPVEGSWVRNRRERYEQRLSERRQRLEDLVDTLVVLRQLALVDQTGAFQTRVELGDR